MKILFRQRHSETGWHALEICNLIQLAEETGFEILIAACGDASWLNSPRSAWRISPTRLNTPRFRPRLQCRLP
jgi:hypothetical protein